MEEKIVRVPTVVAVSAANAGIEQHNTKHIVSTIDRIRFVNFIIMYLRFCKLLVNNQNLLAHSPRNPFVQAMRRSC